MKIVFVNRYFHPDQSATSRMVSSLAFALARKGFPVTVIASGSHYDGTAADLPRHERIHGVEIHRLAASRFGRGRLTSRSADYATFHIAAAAWLLANARRGDVCVVCTDPPLLSVSVALPLKLRGARLVNWVMDLFPETAIELELFSGTGVLAASTLALRDWSVRTAALTICPIDAMSRHLAGRLGSSERIATVRHWANDAEVHPVEPSRNALRRAWGLQDSFVVGYSGNFGRAHEFSTLLSAAQLLRDEPIRFLLICDGPRRAAVKASVGLLGLSNVMFKPYQSSSNLAESLGAADVHIVSLLPNLEYCVIPSKLYGILAAARPTLFVGDPQGEIGSVLRMSGCGRSVAPGDFVALAALIARLRDASQMRAAMGDRALALVRSEYSLDAGVARWMAAVHHLLPQPHAAPSGLDTPEVAA